MRISWVTESLETEAKVDYDLSPGVYGLSASGTTTSYKYVLYNSGAIHEVVIGPLNPNTLYYYRCGHPPATREFSFKTPPTRFPVKFAVVGTSVSQIKFDMLLKFSILGFILKYFVDIV